MLVKSREFFLFFILVSDQRMFEFVGECVLSNSARYLIDLSQTKKVTFLNTETDERYPGLLYEGKELIPVDCRITNTNRTSLDDHPLKHEFDLISMPNVNEKLVIVE